MTIHSEHPFADPEPDRSPLRRFRGRMALPVTIWTSGGEASAPGSRRTGWTISSLVLADGDPPEVLGLLDEDSDLATSLRPDARLVVNLLTWPQRQLADAFAGQAPAPGGLFATGDWTDTRWGPYLNDTAGWLGVRVSGVDQRLGWSLAVRGEVEHVELGQRPEHTDHAFAYFRGRYRDWSA